MKNIKAYCQSQPRLRCSRSKQNFYDFKLKKRYFKGRKFSGQKLSREKIAELRVESSVISNFLANFMEKTLTTMLGHPSVSSRLNKDSTQRRH